MPLRLLCPGCATITRGTTDVLVVDTVPQGAEVKLSDGQSCDSTPCSFKLPRKSEIDLAINKARRQPHQTQLTLGGAG